MAQPNLSASAVLGLRNQGDAEWVRLRGLQFSALAGQTFHRVYAHAVMAVLVAQLYFEHISLVWLVGWVAALALINFRGTRFDRSLANTDRRALQPTEFFQQTINSVVSGMLWSVPILFFAPLGSAGDLAALLLILAMLTLGSITFYSAAPAAVASLTALVGLATATHLIIFEMWFLAVCSGFFTVTALLGTITVCRTFLKARLAECNLAEKEEVVSLLLREFEENEADWLWEIDTNRKLRSISPRFAFALGYRQEEAEGKPLMELISSKNCKPSDYAPSLRELAGRLKHRENFSNLLVHVTINGDERWWELSGTPMRDDRDRFVGFRGVGSDVTEQRESSEKIAYLARYDTLTSLPNRLQLHEALGDALSYAAQWRTRCALMMVDLDRFKAVNDSLGHMTGDKLLAQVSSRLQSILGKDQMCGRLGGDEFAIVIRDASNSDRIEDIARKVIATLSEPYEVDQHTLYVGASVGSAYGPRDGDTVEELMRNADLALYRAKDTGGGAHCRFEPALHASAEERRRLEASLRQAILSDEFVLHYQPVVDARSEKIVSFEALVRWNSPEHGFVSPGKFIPLAEDTRLIVPIGRWVLQQACMEARAWPEHVKVNVNVSPEQLLEPHFHEEVIEALATSGLRPERLEVEVTESIFVRDATTARNSLEQIMALGCSVALDDFGTGYSSLGYLRTLRFSTIKVDRSFVQGAAQKSNESLAIINAVVAMAKSLDMTTTAEGVETPEEAELIRNLGCDKIQGFYFGRPMVKEDARRLFKRHTRQLKAG
ncbi:putative bifunctional diguanylate cyclase/phosphodiesterase [Erythrobacter insulae]|uniref:putative bifunctional diguanylate cyclase/phosphodiesterase n=1 Tax=Erythrobacter insulae TaxID=2584124 RepID=UPI001F2110C5|nr:EAL domain-containing protein [Erythrobacter insulae]